MKHTLTRKLLFQRVPLNEYFLIYFIFWGQILSKGYFLQELLKVVFNQCKQSINIFDFMTLLLGWYFVRIFYCVYTWCK